jgi:hypothetical protein
MNKYKVFGGLSFLFFLLVSLYRPLLVYFRYDDDATVPLHILTGFNATTVPECLHFYFDFGTNVGIQIRKLYEPELFLGSEILPIFDSYFGVATSRRTPGTVCAIGVEPNSAHEDILKKIESSYNNKNWFTRIYTRSGVGLSYGWMLLKSDGDKVNKEWGAHLVSTSDEVNSSTPGAVRLLDVVEIIRGVTKNGIRSKFKNSRKVVVKVDIEGMDRKVIEYMKTSGVLCKIDFVYVEHMDQNDIWYLNLELFWKGCRTRVVYMDDELYHDSNFPLP